MSTPRTNRPRSRRPSAPVRARSRARVGHRWTEDVLSMHLAPTLDDFIRSAFEMLPRFVRCDFVSAVYRRAGHSFMKERDSLGRTWGRAFMRRYAALTPAIPAVLANPGIKILTSRAHIPRSDAALHRTPFYREIMRAQGWRHLTYRQIFMDGRPLESAPYPTWMGYSVGRWDGDILVVDSFGFNDRTWLNNLGLPHTEGLRITERYQRTDFGHVQLEVTLTDPAAYTKPQRFTVNMELAADTEMLETVCETGSDKWTGSITETRQAAVTVASEILATYVGTYSGIYAGRPRRVEVTREGGGLFITGFLTSNPVLLIPLSDTLFTSTEGLSYSFVKDANGAVINVVEIHASGNYPYRREP